MKAQPKQSIPVKTAKASEQVAAPGLHPVADLEKLFDRMMDRLSNWRRPLTNRWPESPSASDWFEQAEIRFPSVDLIDRDDEIVVRAEVPGIEKKDIDISMTDNLLTIKGNTSSEKKEEKGNYHRHEISKSSFSRSILLPGAVDTAKAQANLKDGLLEINLPKIESSKKRNIQVK